MKKILALVLALVMVLMVGASFAQTVGTAATGKGSITISNASRGETYKVTKIFDATVTGTADGSIAYLGTIPSGLTDYFEYILDSEDNQITDPTLNEPYVKLKSNVDEAALFAKLQELYSGTTGGTVSDGSELVFQGLDYGYYVVSTSQGNASITVTSTNPDAEVVDKNTTTPTASKTVDDADVYIGETVTYTLAFDTTNWMGQGDAARQVIKYEIADTLPNYLTSVNVTSIIIDEDGDLTSVNDQTTLTTQQFSNKKITIDWADKTSDDPVTYQNKYKNGVKIVITYTATVTDAVNVGDADGNRNVVTLTPLVDKGGSTPEPWNETFKDDEKIYTYGAAFHKVDENGAALTGAKFKITGLSVTGSNGQYTVTDFDASSSELGDEMVVDDEGYVYILGLASDVNLSLTETEAPAGYNKLTAPETLSPIKMSETTTYTSKTVYYDSEGKVVHESVTGGTSKTISANNEDLKDNAHDLTVINNKGTELPSTGGIGTTIFYIVGGLLVIGAAVILVARRKAHD